mmetsp:Transcript_34863/g.79894  ORF Transcript_34863/g.79894 Transcript_34863/m.79894 type:complete len:262 (+) Transcript_34863:640-1425(+)
MQQHNASWRTRRYQSKRASKLFRLSACSIYTTGCPAITVLPLGTSFSSKINAEYGASSEPVLVKLLRWRSADDPFIGLKIAIVAFSSTKSPSLTRNSKNITGSLKPTASTPAGNSTRKLATSQSEEMRLLAVKLFRASMQPFSPALILTSSPSASPIAMTCPASTHWRGATWNFWKTSCSSGVMTTCSMSDFNKGHATGVLVGAAAVVLSSTDVEAASIEPTPLLVGAAAVVLSSTDVDSIELAPLRMTVEVSSPGDFAAW